MAPHNSSGMRIGTLRHILWCRVGGRRGRAAELSPSGVVEDGEAPEDVWEYARPRHVTRELAGSGFHPDHCFRCGPSGEVSIQHTWRDAYWLPPPGIQAGAQLLVASSTRSQPLLRRMGRRGAEADRIAVRHISNICLWGIGAGAPIIKQSKDDPATDRHPQDSWPNIA